MRFTKDHQWVELQGDTATLGVSAWAGEYLSDVVEVSLPAKGAALKAGDPMLSVEATDRTLALPAPIDGEVIEVNDEINDTPELIDTSPEKLAWLVKLKAADPKQVEALMDRNAYEAYLDSL